jgi:hypothetical protein
VPVFWQQQNRALARIPVVTFRARFCCCILAGVTRSGQNVGRNYSQNSFWHSGQSVSKDRNHSISRQSAPEFCCWPRAHSAFCFYCVKTTHSCPVPNGPAAAEICCGIYLHTRTTMIRYFSFSNENFSSKIARKLVGSTHVECCAKSSYLVSNPFQFERKLQLGCIVWIDSCFAIEDRNFPGYALHATCRYGFS